MVNKFILTSAVALGLATSASAAPLYNVSVFDYNAWAEKATDALAVETFEQSADGDTFDFENTTATNAGGQTISGGPFDGARFGELSSGGYTSAQVGVFTTIGGTIGTGSTCGAFDINGDNCSDLALQYDPAINGQGNTAPVFVDSGSAFENSEFDQQGFWSLNSNDTKGINWMASLADGGTFGSLFFILRDAGDAGKRVLDIATSITVDGVGLSGDFNDKRLGNDNRLLVHISFLEAVESANVAISTSKNDAFTIDGVGISPVPLPASALFLLAGVGGLAAFKRRRKAA